MPDDGDEIVCVIAVSQSPEHSEGEARQSRLVDGLDEIRIRQRGDNMTILLEWDSMNQESASGLDTMSPAWARSRRCGSRFPCLR
jgi:hypothetical protein